MTHAREALFIAVGSFIAVAVMVVSRAIEPSGKSFGTNALRPPLVLQAQTGTDGAQADAPEWDVVVYPPEASANGFDVSPYVGAYAFCKNTPGSAQPKAIVDTGRVSFLFYKSSNEEMHQFLAKMQELPEETSDGSPAAIDPVSLWNGKFYYSKAYIVQNPDGAQYGEAPTVEDGFMYYIAAVPNDAGAKIHFSCATGLTPSDAVPRCGNGNCETGENCSLTEADAQERCAVLSQRRNSQAAQSDDWMRWDALYTLCMKTMVCPSFACKADCPSAP